MLRALGEALGDDLGIEGVRKDLGPVLEWAVGGDEGGAAVVVTLRDDLEGELGLRRVHGEDGEVVDGEQLGGEVATEDAVESAVELGAVEIVEQARSGDEEDAAVCLAGAVGEGAGEEGLAGAGGADEERIDPLIDKGEVVKGEITAADFFASVIEIEVESVDGVDLGEA